MPFAAFNNRLPDPTFMVDKAGAVVGSSGSRGPGFASVSVTSSRPAQVSRTNSGRGIHRESGSHTWEINITYNPMFRGDFDVVSSFLDFRNGRLNPFYVVLPQNSKPKDPVFASYVLTNEMELAATTNAGATSILIDAPGTISGSPSFGDFLNIVDPNDINHQKTYKVTAVETNANYKTGSVQPSVSQVRVHIMPPLTRQSSTEAKIRWTNPQFRVIQKSDIQEYSLNTDNLYSYSLAVEEISA
jgi:hypothetical protein